MVVVTAVVMAVGMVVPVVMVVRVRLGAGKAWTVVQRLHRGGQGQRKDKHQAERLDRASPGPDYPHVLPLRVCPGSFGGEVGSAPRDHKGSP